MNQLFTDLKNLSAQKPFHTGWYLYSFASSEALEHNSAQPTRSASTRKIAIMMAILARVYKGDLHLLQPLPIEEEYQHHTGDSGCFQYFQPGFSITLQDAITMMIIVSDNACAGKLADMVGLENLNKYCKGIGMLGTIHRYGHPKDQPRPTSLETANITTPYDVALLLNLIQKGTIHAPTADLLEVSPDLCNLAIKILKADRLNSRMPFFLPHGIEVAHKTGTMKNTFNDAGVVYDPEGEPLFTLAAYTDEVPFELEDGTPGHAAASLFIGEMTRMCFDALK